jgi:hypothetical protein
VARSVLIIATIIGTFSAQVHAQGASEYRVKAAFVYNFAKFVEWPPEAFAYDTAPLVIGIVGEDPFGNAIDQLTSGKTINGRSLTIRRLKRGQDLKACHILFISSSERNRLPEILLSLKGASVLTIADMDHFSQRGGMIGFLTEDDKVRFEINAQAANWARLRISSKLLTLAKNVKG